MSWSQEDILDAAMADPHDPLFISSPEWEFKIQSSQHPYADRDLNFHVIKSMTLKQAIRYTEAHLDAHERVLWRDDWTVPMSPMGYPVCRFQLTIANRPTMTHGTAAGFLFIPYTVFAHANHGGPQVGNL